MNQIQIDRAALLRTAAGESDLALELLEIFVRTFSQDIETLDVALQTDDVKTASHLLHRIKGSLQILSIPDVPARLDAISRSLSTPIDAEQASALKDLFACFQVIMEDAVSILEANAL